MDDDTNLPLLLEQQTYLCSEIARLEAQIKKPTGKSRDDEDSWEQNRRLLQVESLLFQQAELEESARIRTTIQNAMKNKLIDRPRLLRDVGNCRLCHQEMKDTASLKENWYGRFWCCGAAACYQCCSEYNKILNVVVTVKDTRIPACDLLPKQEKKHCPFCYCRDFQAEHGQSTSALVRQAKAGTTWAQFEVAQNYEFGRYENGWNLGVDRRKAGKLYKRAADRGHVPAVMRYGQYLQKGVPEKRIAPRKEQAKAYILSAARQGLAAAQYEMSGFVSPLTPGCEEEHVMWTVLAAAQGHNAAEMVLGVYCEHGAYGVRQSDYAAIYWLRKAATKGHSNAGVRLAKCLILAKKKLFGAPDEVGHSAMPEAFFWFHSPLGEDHAYASHLFLNSTFESTTDCCGCCGNMVCEDAQWCTKCHAIVYCSKECQARHWKLGHKTDCERVDKYRSAYDKMKGFSL